LLTLPPGQKLDEAERVQEGDVGSQNLGDAAALAGRVDLLHPYARKAAGKLFNGRELFCSHDLAVLFERGAAGEIRNDHRGSCPYYTPGK